MFVPPEAATQGGRFTYQQARAVGWTSYRLERAVHSGLLVEPAHGVYAAVGEAPDAVAVHANLVRDVQLSGRVPWYAARRSGALLMGLPLIGSPPTRAQLVRDGQQQGSHGRDRHLRISPLPSTDTWEYNGIAMTTAPRTVADIARVEPFRNAVVVADAALRRGMPPEELAAVVSRMARWPGIRNVRRVMAFADGRSESPGESLTRVICSEGGLPVPVPVPQVEVYLRGVFVARLDLMIEEFMLGIEFDGAVKFTGEGVLPDLLERHELVRDAGVDLMRTAWDETFSNPAGFVRRLHARMLERGPRSLPPGTELRQSLVRPQPPLLGHPLDHAA